MEEKILADILQNYGIDLHVIEEIDGGWCNRLWKATDGQREYTIKQYSKKRFSQKKLSDIESALQRQIRMEPYGIPFPHIYPCHQRPIRFLDADTVYMVMDFVPGWNETPETVTLPQLESLGSVCAGMHKGLSRLMASAEEGPDILSLLEGHIRRQRLDIPAALPAEYRETLWKGDEILRRLSRVLFNRIPKGFAHEDFTPDNILFNEKGVTAIIDFDRNCRSYPLHDVGRAILSFALEADGEEFRLNPSRVQALINGYSRNLPLSWADAADALRITWCIEFPWWISPYCFTSAFEGKAIRYRQEIQWLTFHWEEISSLLEPPRQ